MTAPELSVVVAVSGATGNLPDILAQLGAAPDVDVVLVSAGEAPDTLKRFGCATLVECAADALIPELWRDGIRRAQSNRVALIASHCIPASDWLRGAKAADLAGNVGVGGAITLAPDANSVQKAIFLQRFSNYSPTRPGGQTADIAADNAVYRKDAILRHEDLLDAGFWEPSFHRRFVADGMTLRYDPTLRVMFRGDDAPLCFLGARYAHGRQYGRSRGQSSGLLAGLGLTIASPLVAPLLVIRVIARALRDPMLRGALPGALAWLIVFAVGWSAGEARGYLDALFRSKGPRA